MQWYMLKCDKAAKAAAAEGQQYTHPKKYFSYKEVIRDCIGEVKRLDEFLFKGTEKLLPKVKAAKTKAKGKDAQASSVELYKYAVSELQKGGMPNTRLRPSKLKQIIIRSAVVNSSTAKQKELAAMVAQLKKAKDVDDLKFCKQMGIVPQEGEGQEVLEYRDGRMVNARIPSREFKKEHGFEAFIT